MPRIYVPKPKKYSEADLEEAVEKVRNGELTYREAETKYNVDKTLLWRKVHNFNTSKQGRKTVLSKEQEIDLSDKIRTMAKWGWALTRNEVREVVHTYIVQNNIPNSFKNNYPGKDWLDLFLTRNNLVSKKMEQLEKSRRQATSDPFIIYGFYDIVQETITQLDLHDKPQQIFNLDETSFSSDPTRIKGVTGKGQKAHRTIQGSGKENTTVLGCISADGKLLPPLIIFKGQNLWSTWKGTKDIPGTTYACSDNGWIMSSIFNEYFANFCKIVTERPLIIIFDGHSTHLDPATVALAVRENIALLKLPPHTTDLLQPMDRSCFGPIKYKWNERLLQWQRLNQRPLSKSEFCDLLSEVWREGLSKEVIINSFKVTGIFPVNKDAYPKDRLDPIKLDRYIKSQQGAGSTPDCTDQCVSPSIMIKDEASLATNAQVSAMAMAISDVTAMSIDVSGVTAGPSQSNAPTLSDLVTAGPSQTNASLSDLVTAGHSQSKALTISDLSLNHDSNIPQCSFETLLLSKIKHTTPATAKRRKIDGKGKLLTSDEYLKSITNLEDKIKQKKEKGIKKKEAMQKKGMKIQKKKGQNKTKKDEPGRKNKKIPPTKSDSETDTDIGEEEIPYDDESDIKNMSLSDLIGDLEDPVEDDMHFEDGKISEEHHHNMNKKTATEKHLVALDELEYGVGDFILVEHKTQKNLQKYYIARIEGSDDDNLLTVIYLKRTKKIFFSYPETHIMYSISINEVVMKLTPPTQTKEKRGALMFDINFEKYNIE